MKGYLTMCKLSPREKQVLELALEVADDTVIAANLGITSKQVSVYKTRVRRKEDKAKAFLTSLRKYQTVLHPKREYKY